MPIRPWPAPASSGLGPPSPRSATLISSASSPQVSAHVRRRAAGVLDRVGQRLLHDAVDGELGAGAERARARRSTVERDRQAGGARALDERAEPVERRRCGAVGRALEHAEQDIASRRARRCRRARMRAAACSARSGSRREDAPRAAGLHDHHADAVRDDVVHLARDPAALVGDRLLRLALAPLGGERGRLVQLGGVLQPRVRTAAAAEPAEHDDDGREVDVRRRVVRARAGRPPRRPRSAAREHDAPAARLGVRARRRRRGSSSGMNVAISSDGSTTDSAVGTRERDQRHVIATGWVRRQGAAGSWRRDDQRGGPARAGQRRRRCSDSVTAASADRGGRARCRASAGRAVTRPLQRQPRAHRVAGAVDRLGHAARRRRARRARACRAARARGRAARRRRR